MKDTTTIKRTAEILSKQGWQVFDIKADSANGPDLTIVKHGKSYRLEVKKVSIGKKNCNIKPVGTSGLKCDAIALLLPNETVLLQPMKEHLALCSKAGTRSVTDLIRLNL